MPEVDIVGSYLRLFDEYIRCIQYKQFENADGARKLANKFWYVANETEKQAIVKQTQGRL